MFKKKERKKQEAKKERNTHAGTNIQTLENIKYTSVVNSGSFFEWHPAVLWVLRNKDDIMSKIFPFKNKTKLNEFWQAVDF